MKASHRIRHVTVAIVVPALLAACGGGSGGGGDTPPPSTGPVPTAVGQPAGAPVTRTLGTGGGTLMSADGRLIVNVPPGALIDTTTISIQPITNHAPHGLGLAYRLGPEGLTFEQPVEIVFRYSDADLANISPGGLGVAFQDAQRYWQAVRGVRLDQATQTLTVSTTRFSDWTYYEQFKLDPTSASVRTNASVALTVRRCTTEVPGEPLLARLVPACEPLVPSEDAFLSAPAVNGVAGGNAAAGTVRYDAPATVTYTAPAQKPAVNPVAVSIELESGLAPLVGGIPKVLLVANVTVVGADAWAGTVATETRTTNSAGDFVSRVHADVAFEFDETTGRYEASAGSVTYHSRFALSNRQPPCETTVSGAATIARGEGFLALFELTNPPQYAQDGLTSLTASGTTTCNDANQPTLVTLLQTVRWGSAQGTVKPDGKTIDDTITTSDGAGNTTTVRLLLRRVD